MVDGLIWDQARQLGESGEYRMEGRWVIYFYVQNSKGGSPYPSQLRTDRLTPVKVQLCTGTYGSYVVPST
jgi:hypothetical protein